MNKLKVFIIDDEEPARALIRNYLNDHDNLEIAGVFTNGFDGIKAINELKPDLVFLDIQMPKLTGFEMLELIDHYPYIIFTTAYDQYAIKAFELNAVDYLLKPFSRERFGAAVNKAIKIHENKNEESKSVQDLLKSREKLTEQLHRIAVRSASKIHVIPVHDIHFLAADGDYVMIHTRNSRYLKEKTMKYFESHLDSAVFVRIHRSYIVNVNEISRIELYDKENHIVLLKHNENRLKASKSGYKLLREVLNL